MVPVSVPHGAMRLVPDSLDLNQRAKVIRDQARALHPNGWAVSATRAVEAQLEKKRGLNTLFKTIIIQNVHFVCIFGLFKNERNEFIQVRN